MAHDETPLLVRKQDRSGWVPWLGIALALSLVGVVVLAILLGRASKSDTPAPPTPTPWDPANYKSAADYYKDLEIHPFGVEDNMRLLRVGNPVLSANGRTIVFTVSQSQMPDFQRRATTLWGVQLAPNESWLNTTAAPVQLTQPTWGVSDSSPQWGPNDKTIFFLSNRNQTNQIWQATYDHVPKWPKFLSIAQVSNLPIDIDTMLISPKFDLVMFSAQVYAGMTIPQSIARDQARAAFGGNYKQFNRLYVRHWDTWVEKRNQLFAASLTVPATGVSAWGMYVNVANIDSDIPTRPFGDSGEWSFSPDGTKFVFCRQHDEFANVSWNTNDDVFLVNISKANPPTVSDPINLTPGNPARDTLPRFSPDGKNIAYLSMAVPGYESDRLRVKLIDAETGAITVLTEQWDFSVDSVTWSYDGSYLMGTVLQDGEGMLQRIKLTASDHGDHVITEGNAGGPVQSVRGEWLFGFQTWSMPNEIHATDGLGTHATAVRVTKFSDPVLSKCQTSPLTSKFSFPGANNDTVNGWISVPANFDPKKTYPVAFLIHGGPQGAWEQGWSWRWNPQVYTGAGFAAVMVNFHGSSGYGQNFTDSIQGNYGSLPFEDLMKGLDFALANFSYLDPKRVAALGASYGGYMIYWIAGQSEFNHRFKCLVAHDGMFDIRTFYYSTEELFFPEHDQPGLPFLSPDNYERYNPINHVANWSLPMLVIHGGLDYRITDSQGLGAFTALQRLNIPSEFLYFPTENHWVLNSRNQKAWHDNVLSFVAKHTP